jgi:hypothetical protein
MASCKVEGGLEVSGRADGVSMIRVYPNFHKQETSGRVCFTILMIPRLRKQLYRYVSKKIDVEAIGKLAGGAVYLGSSQSPDEGRDL